MHHPRKSRLCFFIIANTLEDSVKDLKLNTYFNNTRGISLLTKLGEKLDGPGGNESQ